METRYEYDGQILAAAFGDTHQVRAEDRSTHQDQRTSRSGRTSRYREGNPFRDRSRFLRLVANAQTVPTVADQNTVSDPRSLVSDPDRWRRIVELAPYIERSTTRDSSQPSRRLWRFNIDETSSAKSWDTERRIRRRRVIVIVVVILLVMCIIAAAVALGVIFSKGVNSAAPQALVFDAKVSIRMDFDSAYSDLATEKARVLKANFTNEMNSIFAYSDYKAFYTSTEVNKFESGSVIVSYLQTFHRVNSVTPDIESIKSSMKRSTYKPTLPIDLDTLEMQLQTTTSTSEILTQPTLSTGETTTPTTTSPSTTTTTSIIPPITTTTPSTSTSTTTTTTTATSTTTADSTTDTTSTVWTTFIDPTTINNTQLINGSDSTATQSTTPSSINTSEIQSPESSTASSTAATTTAAVIVTDVTGTTTRVGPETIFPQNSGTSQSKPTTTPTTTAYPTKPEVSTLTPSGMRPDDEKSSTPPIRQGPEEDDVYFEPLWPSTVNTRPPPWGDSAAIRHREIKNH